MIKSFLEAKNEFDSSLGKSATLSYSIIPVDGKYIKNIPIKNQQGQRREEYYKWQFFYALIYSGLYPKDYLGTEVYFPKGNKNAAPLKLDGAIFEDKAWVDWYQKWREEKSQDALDWLRSHLICAIEFKKEDGKDTESVYNTQLKPALKESESEFCIGAI